MGTMVSQITSITIVYSTVYSDADQRKHQSSTSLAFVWGIHRGPVNSPHKWPVTRKMFPFDDVIMIWRISHSLARLKFHQQRQLHRLVDSFTIMPLPPTRVSLHKQHIDCLHLIYWWQISCFMVNVFWWAMLDHQIWIGQNHVKCALTPIFMLLLYVQHISTYIAYWY